VKERVYERAGRRARRRSSDAVLARLPDVVFELDLDLRYRFVSRAVEQHTGVSPAGFLGHTIDEVGFEPESVERFTSACHEVIDSGEPTRLEWSFGKRHYRSRLVPERDMAGRVVKILGITEDITAARAKGERRNLIHRALVGLSSCVTPAEIVERIFQDGLKPVGAVSVAVYVIKAGGGVQLIRTVGEEQDRSPLQIPLVCPDGPLGTLWIWLDHEIDSDSDERATIEALADGFALALARAKLFEEVARARADAEALAWRLREAVESRERLIGMLGHDLRAPLAAILFSLMDLSERMPGSKPVRRIERSAHRMDRMIRQILDVARLQHGTPLPLHRTWCDLDDIVRDQIEEVQAGSPEREIHVRYVGKGGGDGCWDADRLSAVISNLLSNAIKHGDGDAPIDVEVFAVPDKVGLRVSNNGPPIPPELRTSLFDAFRTSSRREGLGLGLSISREIVEAHGGTIEVASAGRRTIFTVLLSKATRPASPPP
jgi:phosphoserine phosphatase RsbU/P